MYLIRPKEDIVVGRRVFKQGNGYFVSQETMQYFVGIPKYDVIGDFYDLPPQVDGVSVDTVKKVYKRNLIKAKQGKKSYSDKMKMVGIMIKRMETSKRIFAEKIKTFEKLAKRYETNLKKIERIK